MFAKQQVDESTSIDSNIKAIYSWGCMASFRMCWSVSNLIKIERNNTLMATNSWGIEAARKDQD